VADGRRRGRNQAGRDSGRRGRQGDGHLDRHDRDPGRAVLGGRLHKGKGLGLGVTVGVVDAGVAGRVSGGRGLGHAHHVVERVVVIGQAEEGAPHDGLGHEEGSQGETGESGGAECPGHRLVR
jgi:hypothetical protein